MDDKGPVLVVLLLGDPHGRHRRQRAKDGTAQPRRVLALRQGEHLDTWGCRLGIEGVCSQNAEGCRLGIQGCSLDAERGAGRVHEVVAWVHRGVARTLGLACDGPSGVSSSHSLSCSQGERELG